MHLILFVATLVISFVVVRIGAVAFQLTGLEWSLAKFQALSCFTGTGFTTREAELIVGHPRRRQIASILMVFGNAGLVALIATFANSLRPIWSGVGSRFALLWTGLGPLVNLVIIGAVLYLLFRFLTRSERLRRLTDYLRNRVRASGLVEPVSVEELVVASGGYGVARAEIRDGSPFIGRTLSNAGLRVRDILVLVIRRGDEAIPNPPASTRIEQGDSLLCFGRRDQILAEFGMPTSDAGPASSTSGGEQPV